MLDNPRTLDAGCSDSNLFGNAMQAVFLLYDARAGPAASGDLRGERPWRVAWRAAGGALAARFDWGRRLLADLLAVKLADPAASETPLLK